MPANKPSLANLRRPRLLVRAARAGVADYKRSRDLTRLTQVPATARPDRVLSALVAEEERVEETRRAGHISYSFVRHIELLVALIADSQLHLGQDPA